MHYNNTCSTHRRQQLEECIPTRIQPLLIVTAESTIWCVVFQMSVVSPFPTLIIVRNSEFRFCILVLKSSYLTRTSPLATRLCYLLPWPPNSVLYTSHSKPKHCIPMKALAFFFLHSFHLLFMKQRCSGQHPLVRMWLARELGAGSGERGVGKKRAGSRNCRKKSRNR
jgi:hypothetical protein